MNSAQRFFISVGLGLGSVVSAWGHGGKHHAEIDAKSLKALYANYLEIQGDLAKDDWQSAQKSSTAFLKQPIKFPKDLSHSLEAKSVLGDFKELNAAKDLEAYRKAFSGFSGHMALLLSEVQYQGDKSVFLFHCPMANGGKGSDWLQSEKDVSNPYFGSQMLRCGTLKKDLGKSGSGEGTQGMKSEDHDMHDHEEQHAHH